MQLFNNGFVIQGLYKNEYTSLLKSYNGIESFVSWPLSNFDDIVSKQLEAEAWNKWFSYIDALETVPDKEYLIRYATHCNELGIKTRVLEIDTANSSHKVSDDLHLIETLGFDCIGGIQLSYLNLDTSYFKKHFPQLYMTLNKHGLFDSYDNACKFLEKYNDLLEQGENLESYATPLPVRLSIVNFT